MEIQYVAVVSGANGTPLAVVDNALTAREWIADNHIPNATINTVPYLGAKELGEDRIDGLTAARSLCRKTSHLLAEAVQAKANADKPIASKCARCGTIVTVKRGNGGGLLIKEGIR